MRHKHDISLSQAVIWAIFHIEVWSIAFYIAWAKFQIEPNALEGLILSPSVIELIITACIKIKKKGKKDGQAEDNSETDEQEVLGGTDSLHISDLDSL